MKKLIVNADDFGYSTGVNRGVLEAHTAGIVTSTSVMVYGQAATDVTALSRFPRLSIGLHLQLDKQLENEIHQTPSRLSDRIMAKVKQELVSQVAAFTRLTGRQPTHIDSHHHVHFHPDIMRLFKQQPLPFRGQHGVRFLGSFNGWDKPNRALRAIGPAALLAILSNLENGIFELMCHPGYTDQALCVASTYTKQRERELKTLTDTNMKDVIRTQDIHLINWREITN